MVVGKMMLVEMLLPDVQTVQISLQNLNAVGIKYIKNNFIFDCQLCFSDMLQ